MKAPRVPYAEREAATLRAMAERTLADPTSSPEDVAAATVRLTRPTTIDGAEYRKMSPAQRRCLRAALDPEAARALFVETRDPSNPDT